MPPVSKMTSPISENAKNVIRPIQYRDLDASEQLATVATDADSNSCSVSFIQQLQQIRRWYWLLKFLSWFPNPIQYALCVFVIEQVHQIRGLIKISPFNRTRSTWRVEEVLVDTETPGQPHTTVTGDIGSSLLRYCFETVWEARTWLLEVNIHHKKTLALYRQNGFQPLAQLTYWAIAPHILEKLAEREPDLPNLLPVSNADAQLLYQLDTASMPPLVRQVFDRHVHDFKIGFLRAFVANLQQWFNHSQEISGYVFEPQRKAAIGYFKLRLSRKGDRFHEAELTVHPAYTFLYPELLAQMARIVQEMPTQSLHLASADYQPEREEYLEQLGAQRIEHSLLMSRSVWHKLREAKATGLEGLQLAEMLQSLQPARTPIPSRITWLKSLSKTPQVAANTDGVPVLTPPSGVTKETPSAEVGEAQK